MTAAYWTLGCLTLMGATWAARRWADRTSDRYARMGGDAEGLPDPWWLTPEQEADLKARIAKRLAEPISEDPPF